MRHAPGSVHIAARQCRWADAVAVGPSERGARRSALGRASGATRRKRRAGISPQIASERTAHRHARSSALSTRGANRIEAARSAAQPEMTCRSVPTTADSLDAARPVRRSSRERARSEAHSRHAPPRAPHSSSCERNGRSHASRQGEAAGGRAHASPLLVRGHTISFQHALCWHLDGARGM